MQSAPFLAQVPTKYLQDAEEREFWDYTVRFFGSMQIDTKQNEQVTLNLDSFLDAFGFVADEPDNNNTGGDESVQIDQSATFKARSISTSGVAVNQEFVLASNNATVTLMSNPPTNAIIKIGNSDGSTVTVIGNGRTINGSTSAQITRRYGVLDFYYFIDTNEWVVA